MELTCKSWTSITIRLTEDWATTADVVMGCPRNDISPKMSFSQSWAILRLTNETERSCSLHERLYLHPHFSLYPACLKWPCTNIHSSALPQEMSNQHEWQSSYIENYIPFTIRELFSLRSDEVPLSLCDLAFLWPFNEDAARVIHYSPELVNLLQKENIRLTSFWEYLLRGQRL